MCQGWFSYGLMLVNDGWRMIWWWFNVGDCKRAVSDHDSPLMSNFTIIKHYQHEPFWIIAVFTCFHHELLETHHWKFSIIMQAVAMDRIAVVPVVPFGGVLPWWHPTAHRWCFPCRLTGSQEILRFWRASRRCLGDAALVEVLSWVANHGQFAGWWLTMVITCNNQPE